MTRLASHGDNLQTQIQGLRIAVLVSLLSAPVWAADAASDIKSLAAAVDAHYNHLRSLEAEFTEVYRGSGMDRTESGTLWLKKPGKMRWEYRSPKEKLFVSNGKDAWFYVPDDRQARKTEARKLEDIRSPLAFLLGKTKLEKELQGLSLAADVTPLQPGNVVLRGVPQALADRISEVLVEVTPVHQIARIVIQEVDGAVTEYRFGEMKEDVEIGANTTIDRGALDETRIRRGSKIDNLVHIGHNCQIGEDVVIAAQSGLSGSITIENRVVLGGQVGIAEHARIGEGVMLGGQAGVLPHKVLRGKGVAFWGTPARPLREYLKLLATLARLAKKD